MMKVNDIIYSKRHIIIATNIFSLFIIIFVITFFTISPTPQYLTLNSHASSGIPLAGINDVPSMRPARYSGANPESWWDMCDNQWQTWLSQETSLAQQIGVTNIREEFPWALIEPQRGVYDWSRADAIVAAANAHHVQLQPVVVYTPSWSSSSLTGVPGSTSDYASFLSTLVNRYKGSIHDWEIWNEPDFTNYWQGSVGQYVSYLLNPGYSAIKAADPSAQVILGGPAYYDLTWINGIYNNGGGNSFDIFAYHEYGSGALVLNDARAWRSFLNGKGQTNMPIWVGEFGAPENTTQDVNQQALLSTVFAQGNNPLAVAQWYNLRDDIPMNGCNNPSTENQAYGLVQHNDTTLKQGFYTLKAIIAGNPVPTTTTTPTLTPTNTPTSTMTSTPTSTPSPTHTPTPIVTSTITATPTKSPQPTTSVIPTVQPTSPNSPPTVTIVTVYNPSTKTTYQTTVDSHGNVIIPKGNQIQSVNLGEKTVPIHQIVNDGNPFTITYANKKLYIFGYETPITILIAQAIGLSLLIAGGLTTAIYFNFFSKKKLFHRINISA